MKTPAAQLAHFAERCLLLQRFAIAARVCTLFFTMTDDKQAPATKQDMAMLMDELGKLYDVNERWKDELKQHFDVVAENIHHDMLKGARSRL